MAEAVTKCPSPQQLADYGLGKLSDGQLSWVAGHLEACPRCRQVVENQPPAPDSFIGQLRAAGAKGGTLLPPTTPAASLSHTILPARNSAAPNPPDGVPAQLAGLSKYEVLSKLGQGGMGAVYKARQRLLNRVVALKVLSPNLVSNTEARVRFLQEMQAVGQLDHRHIVPARDAEKVGDLLVLAMEYVQGISLDRLVTQRGPLPIGFACDCIAQAALGLQHAFEKGLVHRDIKPGNLMVTAREKEVKILDFGLARLPREQGEKCYQTQLNTFMGTPEYVAPEQATNASSADIRADVYSLGCSLYFLLAGRPPFRGKTVMETILAQVQDEAQPLTQLRRDVPPALWDVVAKMLAKKPEERYQTPAEVGEALQPFVQAAKTPAPPPPLPAPGCAATAVPPDTGETTPVAKPSRAVIVATPVATQDTSPFGLLGGETDARGPSRRSRNPQSAVSRPGRRVLVAGVAAGLVIVFLVAWLVLTVKTPAAEVTVEIDQPGVQVFVDGRKLEIQVPGDKGPIKIEVEEGTHKLKVEKDGFVTHTESFAYRKGKKTALTVKLQQKPVLLAPAPDWPREITNAIGMKLVRIPKGKFTMGSPGDETDRENGDVEKQHLVEITKDYWLGVYEVTQGQFKKVMGYNPSSFSQDGEGKVGEEYKYGRPGDGKPGEGKNKVPADTGDFPVELVSWQEAQDFCDKLTARYTEQKLGRKYRLPTEAEWEHACRGGASSYKAFAPDKDGSNSLASSQANFNGACSSGGAEKGPYLQRTCRVGSYSPNGFGLYDMQGNVWEWCSDWYAADYYIKGPLRDPPGPSEERSFRVLRGGSWGDCGADCRSAHRGRITPGYRARGGGFRVALVPSEK